jgi:hypothetical protein
MGQLPHFPTAGHVPVKFPSLTDELAAISQVPALFGTGIPYFGDLVGGHVVLEDPIVVQGHRALHLR